tara:strand:- start:658 stop:873 length:216 start_codon:yes stop_codon:yes gene_type:complete
MRQQERQKQKTQQHYEMNSRRVDRQSNEYNQSVAAAEDTYMRDALTQVRQSDVTHNETLMRHNGTWMWNKK